MSAPDFTAEVNASAVCFARMTPLIHLPLTRVFLRDALRVALNSFLRRDNMLICRIDGAAKLLEQKG